MPPVETIGIPKRIEPGSLGYGSAPVLQEQNFSSGPEDEVLQMLKKNVKLLCRCYRYGVLSGWSNSYVATKVGSRDKTRGCPPPPQPKTATTH